VDENLARKALLREYTAAWRDAGLVRYYVAAETQRRQGDCSRWRIDLRNDHLGFRPADDIDPIASAKVGIATHASSMSVMAEATAKCVVVGGSSGRMLHHFVASRSTLPVPVRRFAASNAATRFNGISSFGFLFGGYAVSCCPIYRRICVKRCDSASPYSRERPQVASNG
jgi:hypothetical protein